MDSTRVVVEQGGIRLGQFLKLCGAADSGAQAREVLDEREVTVNGDTETRRGRQLAAGDVVVVSRPAGDRMYEVALP